MNTLKEILVDAARYRWLRENGFEAHALINNINSYDGWGKAIDDAIDAVLSDVE